MRKVISCLIILCVLSAIPLLEVSGASLAISKISKKTAGPFDVIKIYGAGFTEAADMRVIFANGAYVVTVPAVCGTKTTLEVGVPFFFDKKTGAIKAAVVKVTVKSKSLGIKSNTLSGFTITDLPRTTQAAGTVTLAFLKDLKTLTGYSKGQLDFLQKASKGKVNTTKAKSQVSKMETNLGALQTALTAIQKGQATTQASSIKVTKASLAISDRIILGLLAQLDAIAKAPLETGVTAAPDRAWVPPDGLAIPSLKEIYWKLTGGSEEEGFNEQKLWEFLKTNEAAVGTVAQIITMATATSFPAIAAAVGGVALVYAMGITFYTLSEYVAYYLGLPSGVTEADGFWPLFESIMNTSLAMVGFRLPKISSWKPILDLYGQGFNDFDMIRQMLKPVKESAPTIIPEFLKIHVAGSWSGKIYCKMEGEPEEQFSFTANFTESGLSLSGKIGLDGSGNVYDVSGAMCGYFISFDFYDSGTAGGATYETFWEFTGNLSGNGRSMAGTHGFYSKISSDPEPLEWNGTWILSR